MSGGRKQPYTSAGIARVPCTRCGAPSEQQWQICADGNVYRGACNACDVELNELVLAFMRVPGRRAKLRAYRRRML